MNERLHVKYTLILSEINETYIFSTDVRKYSNTKLKEILVVGAERFHADG